MPRPEAQIIQHLILIAHTRSARTPFNNLTPNASYNLYKKSLSSSSYDRILALAVSSALQSRKYTETVIAYLQELLDALPVRERLQRENLAAIFRPVSETSASSVRILRVDEISVFSKQDVLDALRSVDEALWRAVCRRLQLVEVAEEMQRTV
ncbi:hypothetical protein SS50377_20553 [Spironucleus salmonicida]|uniref:Uncharacterized protein n=1 Tax=Spironucleus salmonicida TaxID=348837 RepID=V6LWJ2_9EUKA|nr:hypothetical protein SS50377_20553 [Spironucleus salmonicida]|eukprot:EST48081.1 Hypothetical protein SS50377_11779 [Spironucleus salmonicida]